MALKLIAAAAGLSFAAHLALAAEPSNPIAQACTTGYPWRVPPKKPGEATNEQYLVIGNVSTTYRICHCSTKAPDSFYLVLNVSRGGRTEYSRLQKSSCIFTNAELVWLRNDDPALTADGTIE